MTLYHAVSGFSAQDVGTYDFADSTTVSLVNGADASRLCQLSLQNNLTYRNACILYQDGDDVVLVDDPDNTVSNSSFAVRLLPLVNPYVLGELYPLLFRIRLRFRVDLRSELTTSIQLSVGAYYGGGGCSIRVLQTSGSAPKWYITYTNASYSSRSVYLSDDLADGDWHTLLLDQTVAGARTDALWTLYLDGTAITDGLKLYFDASTATAALWLIALYSSSDPTQSKLEVTDIGLWITLPDDTRAPYAEITPQPGGVLLCSASVDEARTVAGYLWDDDSTEAERAIGEEGYYSCTVTDSAGDTVTAHYYATPARDVYTGVWSTGATAQSITVTQSGTYTYTVTNEAGTASDSVTVEFASAGLPEFVGDPVPVGYWIYGSEEALEYRTGLATVQSQYATSARILALAQLYWDYMDPAEAVNLLLDSMINPQTAAGYGLDVWGRIVGIKRSLVPVDSTYLAYESATGANDDGDTWNNAPFNPATSGGLASDAVFRIYVFVKAMLNIGNGSLASLNYYFSQLFPDSGIQVIHPGTMVIRVLDYETQLTEADIYALKNIDWVPAGVGWQLWQGEPDCFGFAGSELQPFDQAPFVTDDAIQFM